MTAWAVSVTFSFVNFSITMSLLEEWLLRICSWLYINFSKLCVGITLGE
uniref:Uncharacterized protein n=1 Tax=Ciona intestinalis TaxID=7719 RepID=H2XVM7_CIOIN